MCQVYYTKEIFFSFRVMPLNIQWYLYYNFIHVYFIKFSNEKVGLNTILTSQFQTYLFFTFIIPFFLKFYSWFTINPIEGSIVSKWNSSKIWIYFFCFCEKLPFFQLNIFSTTFFIYLPCFHRFHYQFPIVSFACSLLVYSFSKFFFFGKYFNRVCISKVTTKC
jgi:hypothetical protein